MAPPAERRRRRPRRGSLERPVNARLVPGTWLLVALPLLLAAFTSSGRSRCPRRPAAGFDAQSPSSSHASSPASIRTGRPARPGALGAATGSRTSWSSTASCRRGSTGSRRRSRASARSAPERRRGRPGARRRRSSSLRTVTTPAWAGRERQRLRHRRADRACARVRAAADRPRRRRSRRTRSSSSRPTAARSAASAPPASRDLAAAARRLAVINLDALAGAGRPRLEFAGDTARSPPTSLVQTAAVASSSRPGGAVRDSALRQLLDLGFPFTLYEQAPFVARGIPAVTLTTLSGDLPQGLGRRPRRHVQRRGGSASSAAPRRTCSARSTRASSSHRGRRATSTSARASSAAGRSSSS